MRTSFLMFVAIGIASVSGGPLYAQAYPKQPIKMIVPFPAGGIVDILARAVGGRIAEQMGQPTVAENKTGAGGHIGHAMAASAPADGYTLLAASSPFSIAPSMKLNRGWHPVDSFAPVSLIGEIPSVIIVSRANPANSLKEFLDSAKSAPIPLHFGSAGAGTMTHLAIEMLKQRAGIKLVHVPYKGLPDALLGVLRNDVAVMALSTGLVKPRLDAGDVRLLAVTSKNRSATVPDVPTVAESGFPNYEATSWFGIVAPAGTPAAIIDRLNAEIRAAVKHPAVEKALNATGIEVKVNTPQEFLAYIKADVERWPEVVKRADIQPQ